ncbi:MAG: hypothetical protein ACI4EF_02145 [Coprococcus sp.]
MKKDYAHKMMNAINLKILQQIMLDGESDTNAIAEAMPEVPVSSIYRHLAELQEIGVIRIASQIQKRGAIKKTYAMNEAFSEKNPKHEELAAIARTGLCIIAGEIQQYFESDYGDIEKDCVDISNVIVNINEQEFKEMRREINEVIKKYMGKCGGERKVRRVSFISSPVSGKEAFDGGN